MSCTYFHSGEKLASIFSPKAGRIGVWKPGCKIAVANAQGVQRARGTAKIHTHPTVNSGFADHK